MTHLFALKRSDGAACYHDCEGTNLRTWTRQVSFCVLGEGGGSQGFRGLKRSGVGGVRFP